MEGFLCIILISSNHVSSDITTLIWLQHCKYDPHSHYVKWAYICNTIAHIYQNKMKCYSYFTNYFKICARNKYATHIPHMPITSCEDIWQLCQHIWTHCNQQFDHKHSYISHYWHMPMSKYACHIADICPTELML